MLNDDRKTTFRNTDRIWLNVSCMSAEQNKLRIYVLSTGCGTRLQSECNATLSSLLSHIISQTRLTTFFFFSMLLTVHLNIFIY